VSVTSFSKNIDSPKSRNLVFTSAGDNANIDCWLKGSRNFDLWISYYGNEKNRYKNLSDFYISKKGGKFPNLQYVYQHWEDLLNHYEAILVLDDDIIINGSEISRLFEIRKQYDLWLLQPAFDPRGKISFRITIVRPFSFLRYTNFVEVTCPLFRKDKLDAFMKIFDPALVGWGTEWWFLDLLATNIKGNVAIVDELSCINPHDHMKDNQREIDLLQSTPERISNWERIKEQHHIKVQKRMVFATIKKPLSFFSVISAIKIIAIYSTYRCKRRVQKLKKRFHRYRYQ